MYQKLSDLYAILRVLDKQKEGSQMTNQIEKFVKIALEEYPESKFVCPFCGDYFGAIPSYGYCDATISCTDGQFYDIENAVIINTNDFYDDEESDD
jgi:hypothetical protein